MDILTPKGRETLAQEAEGVELFERHNSALKYCHTPKSEPADVDGIIVGGWGIRAVVEMKCRTFDLETFRGLYQSKWLVTFDKIVRCVAVAKSLCVPFYGFLYLPEEKVLFTQIIWMPEKGFVVEMKIERTLTQETVNGGMIERSNAYIDMLGAKKYV